MPQRLRAERGWLGEITILRQNWEQRGILTWGNSRFSGKIENRKDSDLGKSQLLSNTESREDFILGETKTTYTQHDWQQRRFWIRWKCRFSETLRREERVLTSGKSRSVTRISAEGILTCREILKNSRWTQGELGVGGIQKTLQATDLANHITLHFWPVAFECWKLFVTSVVDWMLKYCTSQYVLVVMDLSKLMPQGHFRFSRVSDHTSLPFTSLKIKCPQMSHFRRLSWINVRN